MAQFSALADRYQEEQRRSDYRAAMICSILAEVYRDKKKRSKAFTPDDFMPKVRERREPMSQQNMAKAVRNIGIMLGAEEK